MSAPGLVISAQCRNGILFGHQFFVYIQVCRFSTSIFDIFVHRKIYGAYITAGMRESCGSDDGTTVAKPSPISGPMQKMRSCLPIPSRLLRPSFTLAVILPAVPVRKVDSVESGCLGNQIRRGQDDANSFALVEYGASPPASREVFYFITDGAIHTGEPPFVASCSYRGPPFYSSFPRSTRHAKRAVLEVLTCRACADTSS